jgi:hypothetical protein
MGFAPTGKRRLFTAHTLNGHRAVESAECSALSVHVSDCVSSRRDMVAVPAAIVSVEEQ